MFSISNCDFKVIPSGRDCKLCFFSGCDCAGGGEDEGGVGGRKTRWDSHFGRRQVFISIMRMRNEDPGFDEKSHVNEDEGLGLR